MGKGIGGHEKSHGDTDIWLTPTYFFDELGEFDLDPCAAPLPRPWPTAKNHIIEEENGLRQQWYGRVWLNPPYNRDTIQAWMMKMAQHCHGTALLFARTDTDTFQDWIFGAADAMLFIRQRVRFHHPDGTPGTTKDGKPAKGGAPSVLIAYGEEDTDKLAECQIRGRFVLLASRTQIIVAGRAQTWRQIVTNAVHSCGGEASLSRLYALIEDDPKCATNDNWQAKIRQQVQGEGFVRVGPGRYRLRSAA